MESAHRGYDDDEIPLEHFGHWSDHAKSVRGTEGHAPAVAQMTHYFTKLSGYDPEERQNAYDELAAEHERMNVNTHGVACVEPERDRRISDNTTMVRGQYLTGSLNGPVDPSIVERRYGIYSTNLPRMRAGGFCHLSALSSAVTALQKTSLSFRTEERRLALLETEVARLDSGWVAYDIQSSKIQALRAEQSQLNARNNGSSSRRRATR